MGPAPDQQARPFRQATHRLPSQACESGLSHIPVSPNPAPLTNKRFLLSLALSQLLLGAGLSPKETQAEAAYSGHFLLFHVAGRGRGGI